MTTAIVLLVLFAVILWAFLIGTAKEDQAGSAALKSTSHEAESEPPQQLAA